MLYNDYDAVFAYGSNEYEPVDYSEEPYTFWNLVDERGEDYARRHDEVVYEAMEQYHFFHNAKTNERAAANKFWSLPHEDRVNILYDYFNEDICYWQKELEGDTDK